MIITLFDSQETRLNLLPFTFTRPVSEIRVGILTIAEKWRKYLNADISYSSDVYLQELFPTVESGKLQIRSNILPSREFVNAVADLKSGQALVDSNGLLLACLDSDRFRKTEEELLQSQWDKNLFAGELSLIENVWDIFTFNGEEILKDFELLTAHRKSEQITDPYTKCYNEKQIFLEEGINIKSAILNAEEGPIYIGKNAQIKEGAIIEGPFALCDNAMISIGGKMRKNSTIGPYAKAGGEVSNSVIFGSSNKSHDGYLGNSVIGYWCNIGADTNASNLKNNYGEIKMWNYQAERFINTGLQFCGLMMGDHSKCAINTMFNTGTMVGVSANIFGPGFPRTSVPSFSWGGSAGYKTYLFNKVIEAEKTMMGRRGEKLSDQYSKMLKHVFDQTSKFRVWEKMNQ